MAYALKWRKRTNMLSAEQLRELEKEIWLSHIHAIVEETDESVSCVVPVGLMHVCCLNSLSTSYPPPHSQSSPHKGGKEPRNKDTSPTTFRACTHACHHSCTQITLTFSPSSSRPLGQAPPPSPSSPSSDLSLFFPPALRTPLSSPPSPSPPSQSTKIDGSLESFSSQMVSPL